MTNSPLLAALLFAVTAPSVALAQTAAAPDAGTESARAQATSLNNEGFKLYRAKKYPQALELFGQATQADPSHALAHYNYAATLGVLRKQNRACEFGALKQAIVGELAKSVELDPARKQRMVKDPDLDTVRDTVGYQVLLGLDPKNPKDLATILDRVSWFSQGQGAYGSLDSLDFQRGGRFVLKRKTVTNDLNHPFKESQLGGTWKLEGTLLRLKLSKPLEGKSELRGSVSAEGALDLEGPLGLFFDHPSECEA